MTARSDQMLDYGASLLRGVMISLRPLREDDLGKLSTWWNDPRWMILQQDKALPARSAQAEDLFVSWSANPGAGGFGYTIVANDDEVVGHVALWGLQPPSLIGTLGIIIGPEHIDKGYGTDAVRVALRIAFAELGAHKVELQTWSFNQRAVHVYSRLGFVEEGRRRAAVFHDASFHDQVIMGMLRDEYHRHYVAGEE